MGTVDLICGRAIWLWLHEKLQLFLFIAIPVPMLFWCILVDFSNWYAKHTHVCTARAVPRHLHNFLHSVKVWSRAHKGFPRASDPTKVLEALSEVCNADLQHIPSTTLQE